MFSSEMDKEAVIEVLNRILEMELAGVVRYTHYSLMVFGPNRLPIIDWLRAEANDSIQHAHQAGELITTMGGHPSLGIGPLLETHKHDIHDILKEALGHEKEALTLYRELLGLVKDQSITLEEYARTLILEEEKHLAEVDKMLRSPGHLGTYS